MQVYPVSSNIPPRLAALPQSFVKALCVRHIRGEWKVINMSFSLPIRNDELFVASDLDKPGWW